MAEVKLINIGKTYEGGMRAVNEVNLTIHDKEFVVLVGPSGCGKTTTLRMIAGLEEITTGELYIGQKKVNDLDPSEREIAMVFQNYALYPHMSAYQNMAFGMKIKKVPKAEIHKQVMEAAEILNITDILQKKPGTMSGGQRQRIAIGRAIVRRPKVFLFDEPLSNLDAKLRGQMRIEIAKLHKKLDATIIYVTHDQVEAMTLGDRVVVMNKGEIVQNSAPIELYKNPNSQFVAEFIGHPKMNLIRGEIREVNAHAIFHSDHLTFNISTLQSSASMGNVEVELGIRAEDIYPEAGRLSNVAILTAKIIAVELLGHEKLVYAEIGDVQLVAKFQAEKNVEVNAMVDFYLNLDKVFFFRKSSGVRL